MSDGLNRSKLKAWARKRERASQKEFDALRIKLRRCGKLGLMTRVMPVVSAILDPQIGRGEMPSRIDFSPEYR
jgi:hypothetical protein